MSQESIEAALEALATPEKAAQSARFFKTGPGQYSEKDTFIGVVVPDQRKVAKAFFKTIGDEKLSEMLHSAIHEHRLTALLILGYQFEKADEDKKKSLVDFYLNHLDRVNNWDLVDSSARPILGHYLLDKPRDILYKLAASGHLWRERVAIVATHAFIPQKEFADTFSLSRQFMTHKHDLIHKAVGWMLREVGKQDVVALETFLLETYQHMPRTTLRYAIEKFPEAQRKAYLRGEVTG